MSNKLKKNKSIIKNPENPKELKLDCKTVQLNSSIFDSSRIGCTLETNKNNTLDFTNTCVDDSITILKDKNTVDELLDVIKITDFKSKELMYYKMLDKYFNNCSEDEIKTMVDIINGNHLISLRFLDWFVTRYCYLYKLSINVNNIYNKEKNFNINISYKAQLKSFKKKYFDPFRRKKKFYYHYDKNNVLLLTTIGQLNFFRWTINNDIIKYTFENYKEIINKYAHVNSYFKKNLIENNSFSTSDENADLSKSDGDIEIISSNKNVEIVKSKHKCPVICRNIFLEF